MRLPMAQLPNIVALLRSFSEDDLARLRLGMAAHFRAFIWHREFGGRAYEWTLKALERRMQGLWAGFFRHRT